MSEPPVIVPRSAAERRRVRRGALIAGLCAVMVLIAGVLVLWPRSGGPTVSAPPAETGPQTGTPQRAPAPSAGGAPTAPPQPAPGASARPEGRPASYARMTAEDSRLYNVHFARSSARCPVPLERRPPLPDTALPAYLQQIADCLTEIHAPQLEQQGIVLSPPRVSGFAISVNTACGTLTRYAFYCPEDRTIYIDTRSDDTARFYGGMRLGYFAVISHEFGHHLQLAGGMTQGYADRLETADNDQRLELSRRSELQAACFSGVSYGALWGALGAAAGDRAEMFDYFDRQSDETTREGTHGSARTMKTWFDRGLGTSWSSYEQCNTWVAGRAEVA